MCALWLVNHLWFIMPVNSWKKPRIFWIITHDNNIMIGMITHLTGCWKNTWRILFVFYQHPTWFISLWTIHVVLVVYCLNMHALIELITELTLDHASSIPLSNIVYFNIIIQLYVFTFRMTRDRKQKKITVTQNVSNCYLWFLSLVSLFLVDTTPQHVFCLW